MNSTVHPMQQLAARIFAEEARAVTAGQVLRETASDRACEKLGMLITRLAGAAGYRSLILRALSLAQAQCPQLNAVVVLPDGSLAGMPEVARIPGPAGQEEAGLALIAHLLGLLNLFIGPALTLQLVGQAWPSLVISSDTMSNLPQS